MPRAVVDAFRNLLPALLVLPFVASFAVAGDDPWLRAEDLCRSGDFDEAAKVAAEAGGDLARYVAGLKEGGYPEGLSERLDRAKEAIAAKRPDEVAAIPAPGAEARTVAEAWLAGVRADALAALGRTAEAVASLRASADTAERIGWRAGAVRARIRAGDLLYKAKEWTGARLEHSRAKELAGPDAEPGTRREILVGLALSYRQEGRLAPAIAELEALVAMAREAGSDKDVLTWLREIALLESELGKQEEALAHFAESSEIAKRLGDEKILSYNLNDSAIALQMLGRKEEALAQYEEARKVFVRRGDRLSEANAIHNIAYVERSMGRFREALPGFQKACDIFESLGDLERMGNALGNIAITHATLGDVASGREKLLRVLEIRRRLKDRLGEANTLFYLGHIEQMGADAANALRDYEAARSIFAELGAEQARDEMTFRMAEVHLAAGSSEASLELFKQALEISQRSGNEERGASCLLGLGRSYTSLGDMEEAHACLQKALDIWKRHGRGQMCGMVAEAMAQIHAASGEMMPALQDLQLAIELVEGDPRSSATNSIPMRVGVGDLYRQAGVTDPAIAAYEDALVRMGDFTVPVPRANAHAGLAELYLRKGEMARAVEHARTAVEMLQPLGEGLSEESRARFQERQAPLYGPAVGVGLATGDPGQAAWFLERVSAGALVAALGSRQALEAVVLPDALRQELALVREEERQAAEAVRAAEAGADRRAVKDANAALTEARKRTEAVVARVQREEQAAAALTWPEPDDLATLESRVGKGEALVIYGLSPLGSGALVVRRGKSRVVSLPDDLTIEAAIDAALRTDDPYVDPEGIAALGRVLVEPLALGKEIRRVVVAPAGRLAYVPFSMLLPGRDVAFTPSGTTHGLLLRDRELRGDGVLALGDPDYGTAAPVVVMNRSAERGRLAPLPATREEAESVGTVVLLGADATETKLREALPKRKRWRAVHLACHGLVNPERPLLSALALSPDAESDGFLTCLDLFSLKTPADLVVLSACETGTGKIYTTEGVLGLTRAFMHAGAPRVLSSLWNVDDEATRALMERFYELWTPPEGPGLPAATALREAQAYIRGKAEWSHPKFWAAWVLWGLPD